MRLCLSVWTVIVMAASINANAAVGVDAYKGKDPIGGGPGYTRFVDMGKATYTVSTLAELKAALAEAKAGDIVYVTDVVIDATGERSLVIPGGVTLAGTGGQIGALGSRIKADKLDLEPDEESKARLAAKGRGSYSWQLFLVGGPNVRVTGLRIQGPDTTTRTTAYEAPNCDAIRCNYPGLEVDNCEIWGWSHAAIGIYQAGQGHYVHHCYLHHCRRMGLGYGVVLDESQALIECNRFVDNRHDIAGTGRARTSYVARYNISEAIDPPISHAFDMHGNHESRPDGKQWPKFAGDSIVICYNTFKSCRPRDGITIRGEPRLGATIHHNVYERARIGTQFALPCANSIIYGDVFLEKPSLAYYRFGAEGNILNGKRMPAGQVTALP